MNYLAHLLLSGPDEDSQLGGIIGDFMRGQSLADFPPGIQKGIERHRAIDRLTDAHAVFRRSRRRLPQSVQRFAGVIIDVCYDHFLAATWDQWHPSQSLSDYTQGIYRLLERRRDVLPPRLQRALPWLSGEDWLASYASLDHLARVFTGMSQRIRRDNPLAEGAQLLRDEYRGIGSDFAEFFPALRIELARMD